MGHLGSAAHHAAAAAAAASSLQFFYQGGGDPHLGQPPPAHMGIPPYQLDPKTAGAMGKIFIISFLLFICLISSFRRPHCVVGFLILGLKFDRQWDHLLQWSRLLLL
jgi:hypothetical protein